MKKTIRGVLLLLLLLSVFVFPAAAATNLITDPNFQSVSPSASSSSFWYYTTSTGDGSASYTSNPSSVTLSSSGGTALDGYYAYLTTRNPIDLTYVSQITVNTESFSGGSNGYLYCYVSSDKSSWSYLGYFSKSGVSSVSVSKTGSYYVRFGLHADSYASVSCTISGAHADDARFAPTYSSGSLSSSTINIGDTLSATVSFDGYPTSPASVTFYWNDAGGTSTISGLSGTGYFNGYSTEGTYDVEAVAHNSMGDSTRVTVGTVTVLPKKPVISSVTVSPSTSGPAGSILTFIANYQNDVNANGFTWDFGDGTTETGGVSIYHTYSTAGTYSPTVTATGPGGTSSAFSISTIHIGSSSVSVDRANLTYTSGESVTFSWSLLNPDYSRGYTFRIYASDSAGTQYTQVITPVPVTDSSVNSYTWNTTGSSGYYVGVIYEGSSSLVSSPVIMVQTMATLTVTLSVDSVTYTNSTTITLYRNGAQAYSQTTTTGSTQFANIVSGTYTITATTLGYSQQSATVSLQESTTINIDFKTGTSSTGTGTGAGGYYSMTYITFRIIDQDTGLRVSGARVSGSAVEATNPVEWLVNQLGGAIGNNVIGTELAGVSDDNGVVSFVMYPNLRYTLTLEHDNLPSASTRTFSPSSLSTEYPWYISFPHTDESTKKNIKVDVTVSNEGLINVTYKDLTQTTSSIAVNVYTKNQTSNEYDIPFGSGNGGGYDTVIPVQLQNYLGKDIKIVVTSQTSAYGPVVKTYYHTFLGPLVDIGLPPGVYIWICLFVAILIGGVAPFVNSYAACFVICFFEWMFWFFGWFFAVGQWTVLPLLIFATVLSVLFYIQSRK